MLAPAKTNPYSSDVLHFEAHSKLSAEEIAKAVARHKREHPEAAKKPGSKAPAPRR